MSNFLRDNNGFSMDWFRSMYLYSYWFNMSSNYWHMYRLNMPAHNRLDMTTHHRDVYWFYTATYYRDMDWFYMSADYWYMYWFDVLSDYRHVTGRLDVFNSFADWLFMLYIGYSSNWCMSSNWRMTPFNYNFPSWLMNHLTSWLMKNFPNSWFMTTFLHIFYNLNMIPLEL
jgi:hypothetical protein